MNAVVVGVSVLLAVVAAAGVLRPFGSRRVRSLERAPDPLDEEGTRLLRTLRDLDEERAAGQLTETDHRELRHEAERRAVAVLRVIDARDGDGSPRAPSPERSRSRGVAGLVLVAVLLAALVPALAASVRDRDGGGSITGDARGVSGIAFFEQRVLDHPGDLAARLDLAERYIEGGNATGAVRQYLEALKLDPENAEAWATLGFVIHASGRPEEGLRDVERALGYDPGYADALYFKGVILLEGLDRPDEAAAAFRAYLAAAPFGSRRSEVQGLLARAEAASG